MEQVHKEVVTKYEESVVSKCLEMPELLRQQTNIIVNLATFDTICYLSSKRSASKDWRWFCTKSKLEIVRSHNSLNKIWTSSLNHLNLATFNTICYLNSKRSASEDLRWFCTKSQLEIVRSHNSLDKIWTSSFEPYYWQKVLVHPSYIPVRLGPLSFMIYD